MGWSLASKLNGLLDRLLDSVLQVSQEAGGPFPAHGGFASREEGGCLPTASPVLQPQELVVPVPPAG